MTGIDEFRLDRETRLKNIGDGVFSCEITTEYLNSNGAFGGWALAIALESVKQSGETRRLFSLTASFLRPIAGEALLVFVSKTKPLGRSTAYRVALAETDAATPFTTIDLVCSDLRKDQIDLNASVPVVPVPEDLTPIELHQSPKWMSFYDQRFAQGTPFDREIDAKTRVWIKDLEHRPLDTKALALLADSPMPRSMFMGEQSQFGSTVQFSLFNFASENDLSKLGSDFLLMDGSSGHVGNGAYDQRVLIWSRSGKLLATSTQIGMYRRR